MLSHLVKRVLFIYRQEAVKLIFHRFQLLQIGLRHVHGRLLFVGHTVLNRSDGIVGSKRTHAQKPRPCLSCLVLVAVLSRQLLAQTPHNGRAVRCVRSQSITCQADGRQAMVYNHTLKSFIPTLSTIILAGWDAQASKQP